MVNMPRLVVFVTYVSGFTETLLLSPEDCLDRLWGIALSRHVLAWDACPEDDMLVMSWTSERLAA